MLDDQMLADNIALIERNRELECELAKCKARLDAVARLADEYHEKAVTILEGWGDVPIGGSDLGRVHAICQMVGEIKETLG